jgi:hypothetical protein
MGDLSTSGLGDSFLHGLLNRPCLNSGLCPQASCATWSWISPRWKERPWSPCGIHTTLISLAHPGLLVSGGGTSWLSREEWNFMESQTPAYLTSLLPWPANNIITWAMNTGRNQLDWPVFPAIHEVLKLLKGTFLIWKPRKSLTPEYLLFKEYSHSVYECVCVCVCVSTCGCIIFFVSVSAKYSVQKKCMSRLFPRSQQFWVLLKVGIL